METEQDLVREQVGYCAQQNTILDLLTVREHLELFAGESRSGQLLWTRYPLPRTSPDPTF